MGQKMMTTKETPISLIYEAIAEAETGGEPNAWIRTRYAPAQGSTAYGPVQLTKSLAQGYLDFKHHIFNSEEKEYLKEFVRQGELFAKYGKEPDLAGYDAKYDYGGSGHLDTRVAKRQYEAVCKKMLNEIYHRVDGDLDKVWNEWRFGPVGGEDERYRTAFFDYIDNNNGED